jgi:membrane protease YdiL (CAAX protease family)/NAD-dependent dihydropyrimidine dehydrogenase PreA subunit
VTIKSAHLTLRPDRCNECGDCVSACPNNALRVGSSYVLVDWNACDHCCACVDVCKTGAITRAVVPLRSSAAAAVAPGDVAKVVVGSRAEAKAVRRASELAAKQAAKASKSPAPSTRRVVAFAPAGASASASAADRRASQPSESHQSVTFGAAKWTLFDVGVVLAVLLATLLGKNAVLALPAVGLMPVVGRTVVRAVVLGAYYCIQLGALAFLSNRRGLTMRAAFGLTRAAEDKESAKSSARPSAAGSLGLMVALFAGVEFVTITYGMAMQAIGWTRPETLSSDLGSVFGIGPYGLLLSVALVALVAPLAEELAFRGVLLPAFGDRWGMWPAIVVSAVFYAVYHAHLWLFFPTLVLGLALGWLAWTRKSLWPAIGLHVLYNSVAVAAAFMLSR